jgi:hypothetical protein
MLGIIIKTSKSNKIKGLRSMFVGDECAMVNFEDLQNMDFDFFVQNGMKKKSRPNNEVYEFTENSGKPILIREAPALRQVGNGSQTKIPFEEQWNRFSWNSFFMDEGLFPYDPSYDRWTELSKKYDIQVHDWARRGDSILLNLQIDGDSALNRLTYNGIDYKNYIVGIIKQIQKISDRPLIVRGHPLDPIVVPYLQNIFSDLEFSTNQSLYEDLDRSWCMVTYNSTSCVESTLYGTPTIVLDSSSISTEVSQTSLEQLEDSWSPDRDFWCRKIAFHQWQGSELTNGYVWNLLKSLVWK